MNQVLARIRLLQLASQALPIGGYSHSYGLEAAIDGGRVNDEGAVRQWIADVLEFSMSSYEIPMLTAMGRAWSACDTQTLHRLNGEFLATRETAELRAATVQTGFSMTRLLLGLPAGSAYLTDTLRALPEPALPCAWSGAAQAWCLDAVDAAAAYAWAWAENQVLVAVKSVPIGQSAGQRILLSLGAELAALAERAASCDPPAPPSNFAPGLAILCSQHETQYSRLFRS